MSDQVAHRAAQRRKIAGWLRAARRQTYPGQPEAAMLPSTIITGAKQNAKDVIIMLIKYIRLSEDL